MDSIVDCGIYSEGRRIKQVELHEVDEALASDDKFVWLRLKDPEEALMVEIQQRFGLHELMLDDEKILQVNIFGREGISVRR
jgi:magnesium transporter